MGWQERSAVIVAYDDGSIGSELRGMYGLVGGDDSVFQPPGPIGLVPAIVRLPDDKFPAWKVRRSYEAFFQHQYGISMDTEMDINGDWLATASPVPNDDFGTAWDFWVGQAKDLLEPRGMGSMAWRLLQSQITAAGLVPAMVTQTWCKACVQRGSWALVDLGLTWSLSRQRGSWVPQNPAEADRRMAESMHDIDESEQADLARQLFIHNFVEEGLDEDAKQAQWEAVEEEDPETWSQAFDAALEELRYNIGKLHVALWDPPERILREVERRATKKYARMCEMLYDGPAYSRPAYDAVSDSVGLFKDAIRVEMELRQMSAAA